MWEDWGGRSLDQTLLHLHLRPCDKANHSPWVLFSSHSFFEVYFHNCSPHKGQLRMYETFSRFKLGWKKTYRDANLKDSKSCAQRSSSKQQLRRPFLEIDLVPSHIVS